MDTKDEEVLVYRAIEALETIADALEEINLSLSSIEQIFRNSKGNLVFVYNSLKMANE